MSLDLERRKDKKDLNDLITGNKNIWVLFYY